VALIVVHSSSWWQCHWFGNI